MSLKHHVPDSPSPDPTTRLLVAAAAALFLVLLLLAPPEVGFMAGIAVAVVLGFGVASLRRHATSGDFRHD